MTKGRGGRETWATRIGVILAVTGSAVGLGNFLRFPGLAAQYEGGAFMIPYFLGLLILGLPIALAEWSMGRYGGRKGHNSPPGIFYAIWKSRAAPFVGALSVTIPVMIYMYYVHLEAWCLAYAWYYLTGQMSGMLAAQEAGGVLGTFSGWDEDGAMFANPGSSALLFVGLCFAVNFALIYRGVARGIEWFCKIAMPSLVICALIILIRVLTLPEYEGRTVWQGLGFMWNPVTNDRTIWQALSNAQMWVDATGQIFFTLSVGFGLIITYASYVRSDDDIALSATTSASGNEFIEVALAGMMIIPAAFLFVGPAALAATGGSGLRIGFLTLPNVFDQMWPGWLFGFLFFFLLFLAAVTSSLSMLQPAIAFLEEGLNLGRRTSVAILGFITAIGAGFVAYFSEGLTALDTFDFWIGSFSLYVLALVMVLIFGWVLGVERGRAELDRGAEIRIPTIVFFILKYVAPVYLLVVFVAWVYQQAIMPPNPDEPSRVEALLTNVTVQLSVGFILLVLGLFMVLTARAVKGWERREQQAQEVSP